LLIARKTALQRGGHWRDGTTLVETNTTPNAQHDERNRPLATPGDFNLFTAKPKVPNHFPFDFVNPGAVDTVVFSRSIYVRL
jgi:hypothetical protein